MNYQRIINGPIEENAYLVWDEESCEGAIIDPGFSLPNDFCETITKHKLKVLYVIDTHGHWDHIKNNTLFLKAFGATLFIHKAEEAYLNDGALNLAHHYNLEIEEVTTWNTLEEGDTLTLGKDYLKVLHTPGHTMGSIILYNDALAFTGDTLFYGSIGRCDLPNSSKEAMVDSLEKIKEKLPKRAILLPGHGSKESTLLEQQEINPFLTGKMTPK